MDDLIPFLIVVLISIVGALSRRKKKRSILDAYTDEPQSRQDDFLGWMDRFVDPEQERAQVVEEEFEDEELVEEKIVPVSKYEEQKPQAQKYTQYSGFISPAEHDKLVKEEGQRAVEQTKKENEESTIKEGEIGKQLQPTEFDLRNAVIFSTILNRKYD